MEIGSWYYVMYHLRYDTEYLERVKCIKITPKSYKFEDENGTMHLVKQDSIGEVRKLPIQGM